MNKATLRKAQLVQLEMVMKVKEICDSNGIQYFLDGGTLLGAVRHQGFIPWDDDLDIGMLRKDYEKFISIAQPALGDQYFLQTWETDDHFWHPFAKIRKIGTVYREKGTKGVLTHNELFIDIFPFDFIQEDAKELMKTRRKIRVYWTAMAIKSGLYPWLYHTNIVKKCMSILKNGPAILLCCLTRNKIKIKYFETMTAYNAQGTKYVDEEAGAQYGKHKLPIGCFDKTVDLLFENEYFKCPQGYDEILRLYYGDYMTLPPEDKRENKHGIIEVKL